MRGHSMIAMWGLQGVYFWKKLGPARRPPNRSALPAQRPFWAENGRRRWQICHLPGTDHNVPVAVPGRRSGLRRLGYPDLETAVQIPHLNVSNLLYICIRSSPNPAQNGVFQTNPLSGRYASLTFPHPWPRPALGRAQGRGHTSLRWPLRGTTGSGRFSPRTPPTTPGCGRVCPDGQTCHLEEKPPPDGIRAPLTRARGGLGILPSPPAPYPIGQRSGVLKTPKSGGFPPFLNVYYYAPWAPSRIPTSSRS